MRFQAIVFFIFVLACSSPTTTRDSMQDGGEERVDQPLDIQGHRGARGLLPENSIPGFKEALRLGVNTLELDVCITGDREVIVSHEPWMSAEICLNPESGRMSEEEGRSFNMYEMTTQEIQTFDCGGLMHARFPGQGKVNITKPLLRDVFKKLATYSQRLDLVPPTYNIELKSFPDGDNLYHPEPAEFVRLVYDVIDAHQDWLNISIQSFDPRILREFNRVAPDVTLVYLVERETDWEKAIESLGLKPAVYSPYYELLNAEIVEGLHQAGIRVIPWTVNDSASMVEVVSLGVDGLITDYPDRAIRILR